MRDPLEELFAFLLRHATGHREHHPRVLRLEGRELAHLASQLLLGLLAHAARVQDHQIGVLHPVGARPAGGAQHLLHPIGVVRVHLTAEGVDEVPAGQSRRFVAREGRCAAPYVNTAVGRTALPRRPYEPEVPSTSTFSSAMRRTRSSFDSCPSAENSTRPSLPMSMTLLVPRRKPAARWKRPSQSQ